MVLCFGIQNYKLENYVYIVLCLHKMQKLNVMFKIHSLFLKDQCHCLLKKHLSKLYLVRFCRDTKMPGVHPANLYIY